MLRQDRFPGECKFAESYRQIDRGSDRAVALFCRRTRHSDESIAGPDPARAGREFLPLSIEAGVKLRRPLNLIARRENGAQGMVGVIARSSIDAEDRVSTQLTNSPPRLAHCF